MKIDPTNHILFTAFIFCSKFYLIIYAAIAFDFIKDPSPTQSQQYDTQSKLNHSDLITHNTFHNLHDL